MTTVPQRYRRTDGRLTVAIHTKKVCLSNSSFSPLPTVINCHMYVCVCKPSILVVIVTYVPVELLRELAMRSAAVGFHHAPIAAFFHAVYHSEWTSAAADSSGQLSPTVSRIAHATIDCCADRVYSRVTWPGSGCPGDADTKIRRRVNRGQPGVYKRVESFVAGAHAGRSALS